MDEIAVSKFKATCLAALDRVRRTGRPLRVTRFGRPLADIVPPRAAEPDQRWLGAMEGRGRVTGDLVAPVAGEDEWDAARLKLLLDTHIWLWSLLDPARLAPAVAAALGDSGTARWLSPLSVWEALLLIERKRLQVDRAAEPWIREALERAPVVEAPVNHEVALASRRLGTRHRDPVDRFLLATAQVFDLTLATQDEELLRQRDVPLLSNRTRRAVSPPGRRRPRG